VRIVCQTSSKFSTISAIRTILPQTITPVIVKHLGLPILFGKSKMAILSNILDKIQDKIEGWRSKTLSQADKAITVKAVAFAIPSYAMSSFMLLDGLCHKLDKAFCLFIG
jgi:hypothetical protein